MRLPLLLALALGAAAPLLAQVTDARLRAARREPANWLTYSGDLGGQRYSPLAQVTTANVAALRPAWIYQAAMPGTLQTSPLVVDGVMYLTEFQGHVVALDARSGRVLWRYQQAIPPGLLALGFAPTNRGVAVLDSTVFVGSPDARLIALDARSGAVRWTVPVADNALGYAITGAPLAVDGLVLTGVSGAEAGIRGFVDAYDARTGERRWRFHTIPGAGEPGVETWGGESWKTGGGSTWVTGSYDPALGLLYWGVGNPGPLWNGDDRPGDNLYTCSLVALDLRTGTLRWHFQFTPHDTHDWDAAQVPVLFEGTVAGRARPLVAMANRNGFYYVLDRATGEFLAGTPYIRQEWAEGLDAAGRPVVRPGSEPTDTGTSLAPNLHGASNWYSPSYSPRAGLFYVAARQMGSRYYKYPVSYTPGRYFLGGGEAEFGGDSAQGAVKALDPLTGRERWSFPLFSPPWAGLLSTAGGLLFGGTNEGVFFALSARTGRPLWHFQTGAMVNANPISYAVGGRQYVAVAAGSTLQVFALATGAGRAAPTDSTRPAVRLP
ncbi:MAG: PQQ-dependent dehydrogenase, methanol/ethanol family [Gemmatimonadetes bacterium]|nr:PQQ-dependent dehydrogenase, methanol/ethanol family [Gemmatimonadota bacterium]